METTTLSVGFGGMLIGQKLPGTVRAVVWPSIKILLPSLASGGPSNVMKILSMTLMALEGFSNTTDIPTPMVGAFLVQKSRKCMELCSPTNNNPQQMIFSN